MAVLHVSEWNKRRSAKVFENIGADSGTRTRTALRPQDFKSCVSTGSTMSAFMLFSNELQGFSCVQEHVQRGVVNHFPVACKRQRMIRAAAYLIPGGWSTDDPFRFLDCRRLRVSPGPERKTPAQSKHQEPICASASISQGGRWIAPPHPRRLYMATAKTSTAAALPFRCTPPRASTATAVPSARRVAPSMRIPRPASLVWVSRRAARFTVSPMQV
jgi:hypothetical protein